AAHQPCSRVSKTQPARGSTEAACQIVNPKSEIINPFGVVADKQCTYPASKLMWERYPPTPPTFARRQPEGEGCPPQLQRGWGLLPVRDCYGCQANFNRGKLDQCTESSLINFFRWV